MLNLYPYLCNDPDMDLLPIRAKSERLYRDILRERQFYADNPDCDNVHFFHLAKKTACGSYWVDRWGIVVLKYVYGKWGSVRKKRHKNTKSCKYGSIGYYYLNYTLLKEFHCWLVHRLVADVFLPNTDFTKCELDHLNSEHLDNNAFNLERVTPEENVRRYQVVRCLKKGKPIPEKYQTPKNYLNYLQNKNNHESKIITKVLR